MLPWIVACFSLFLAIESLKGKYFTYYDQSSFTFRGNVPECTLTATYDSGGNYGYSGCRYETKSYKSQQEFDLEYYELLHVCPELEYVPVEYRGVPDYSSSNSLPSELVWPTSCAEYSSYTWCPRWQCDNSSSLWDRDFNESYSYHETNTLSFSSIPIRSQCWQCICNEFTQSYDRARGLGKRYAWDCYYERWDKDPIYDPDYDNRKCIKPTLAPTPQPTPDPIFNPTPQPTPNPVINYCSNVWGNNYAPTSYYWNTDASGSCAQISLCYCNNDGTGHCETGWDSIMNDVLLYPNFLERCTSSQSWNKDENYLASCWKPSSSSLLFSWYDYTNVGECLLNDERLCPRCGCEEDPFTQTSLTNTTFLGTTFDRIENTSSSVAKSDYVYEYKCSNCSCVYQEQDIFAAPRSPLTWVDPEQCVHYDETNNDDADPEWDCIEEQLKCFYISNGEYIPNGGTSTCNDDREGLTEFGNACSFERFRLDDSSPGKVCVEHGRETLGEWGCTQSYECELYGGPGCYKAAFDYKVTEYDCMKDKWLYDTYSADVVYTCCNDDHYCNNRTMEEHLDSDCSWNDRLSRYSKYKEECSHSQYNLHEITSDKNFLRAAYCGDSLSYDDYADDESMDTASLCKLLKVYWQYNTFCDCNLKRIQIQTVKAENTKDADLISKFIRKQFWTSTRRTYQYRLQTMYEYWQCDGGNTEEDTFFKCDFNADVESINNKDSVYRISALYSILSIFGIMWLFGDKYSLLLCLCMVMWSVNGEGELSWYQSSGSVGDCQFIGSVSSSSSAVCESISIYDYRYQEEDLPWSVLIDSCPDLEYAGCWTKDNQIDQKDLIWRKDACSCPRCPCSNKTDTERHYVHEQYNLDMYSVFMRRNCQRCTCSYWSQAEDWGWDCSSQGYQYPPYMFNDTEFCPATDAPTVSPTEPMSLDCVYHDDGQYTSTYSMHGDNGVSHCSWNNISISRYDDGEPSVCAYDDIMANKRPPYSHYNFPNTQPLCLALAGEGSGCYYANFNMDLSTFDCALNSWVSDKYLMDVTVWCCNNGYYCNNQTAVRGKGHSVEYINYDNETVSKECVSSKRLKEYTKIKVGCEYSNWGLDEEYTYKRLCKGGVTTSKPGCSALEKWWKWRSKCDCDEAEFFLSYVNATYDKILNEQFDDDYDNHRDSLGWWNDTLDCGWAPNTKWFCSNAQRIMAASIIVVFISVSHLFIQL